MEIFWMKMTLSKFWGKRRITHQGKKHGFLWFFLLQIWFFFLQNISMCVKNFTYIQNEINDFIPLGCWTFKLQLIWVVFDSIQRLLLLYNGSEDSSWLDGYYELFPIRQYIAIKIMDEIWNIYLNMQE